MRRLSAEERALWDKVVSTVQPLRPRLPSRAEAPVPTAPAAQLPPAPVKAAPKSPRTPPPPAPAVVKPGTTLDGGWDRRLSRGLVQPDLTVDLHGHNLQTAWHLLDLKLEQGMAVGVRVMLLITGKPPTDDRRPVARGAIRAAVGDWLAASRHAADIAAVRNAHPRHGGSGALYIVLRRQRAR